MASPPDADSTLDVPDFFMVKGRSGDPSTEELHARTSQRKRFNNGQAYALRGRHGKDASPPSSSHHLAQHGFPDSPLSAALLETDTHAIVRAGTVPAAAIAAAASRAADGRCSGKVLSHGWAFLCVDGGILAWEQGMLSAERTGGAVSADQSCLRFDHPSMAAELATMEALEVHVEAADLVSLTQPWEACGGKRELLVVSPAGLGRYWPDLCIPLRFTVVDARFVVRGQSVTRVVALAPGDFVCGLSKGSVLRIRPGLAQPSLLSQSSSSVLGLSFSTIKRVGTYIGSKTFATAEPQPASAPASTPTTTSTPVVGLAVVCPPWGSPSSIPSRIIRLTTETLEVWSVSGGDGGRYGTENLEVRQAMLGPIESASGVEKACLLDVAVGGVAMSVSPGGDASSQVWSLELLVLAAGERSGRGSGGGKEYEYSVHVVRVSSGEASSWVGSSVVVKLISSYRLTGGVAPLTVASLPSLPRAKLVVDKEAFYSGGGTSNVPGLWGSGVALGGVAGVHVFLPISSPVSEPTVRVWSMTVKVIAGENDEVEWKGRGSVEVSTRFSLVEGSVGGGASLKGCPGLILLSKQGQAIWVAPRNPPGGGRAVDLEYPEMSSEMAAKTWRAALLDEGLNAFEGGVPMESARAAAETLLLRGAQGDGIGGGAAGGGGVGAGTMSSDIDAAIAEVGLEVLNGSWRHPAAFASSQQLVHLALREKTRRHRALVRFLLDSGVLGVASAGRAALAEGGEKVAAASRLCELRDAISRNAVGVRAARLLEESMRLSLEDRRTDHQTAQEMAMSGGAAAAGRNAIGSGANSASNARDIYFEHTEGVLDAFLALHTPREDDNSNAFGGGTAATSTPLERSLRDPALGEGDRLALLNQISLVIAGVFEAALRHRASERNVYRSGPRGKVWTFSPEAKRILFRQLQAYAEAIERVKRADSSDVMCGVIGRLSVLLLDGFKEEEHANPAASDKVEWQDNYLEAKTLCVRVLADCGREELARSLADKHRYAEGTISLCHEAEMRKPGCPTGHCLLRSRMEAPPPQGSQSPGETDENQDEDEEMFSSGESEEERLERENLVHLVLDWHLRRGFKTALLDVGAVVPDILCEFLADWREAELLWMFQIRLKDYTGAGRALTRGSPPSDQKGGRCEAQHLWLSLAKLAFLAERNSASADPAHGAEVHRRLELAEVREKLVQCLPADVAADVSDKLWTWREGLAESVELVNSYSTRTTEEEVYDAADIAFQGYRSLVAGLPEKSYEHANELWREVIRLTLDDPHLKEAVAKGAMSSGPVGGTAATDREMEAAWKRPTVLHLLLRAISIDRRRRRDTPWSGGGISGAREEEKIDLTDDSLACMVDELMPAAADGGGATCESWIAAIRKCPW